MLSSLHIFNYAIIDEIRIDFSQKLNVITGETGAGKSILMGALSLILGDRADTSVLQNRDKKCIVEGTFSANSQPRLKQLLSDNDLEGGDEIIIRREIAANGKSRAFVNDTPVNLEQLKQVSSLLVDLHRQFDTLSLSDAGFQREVLDALAGNSLLLQQYQTTFRSWKAAQTEADQLKLKKASFDKEYDYHKFLFDELEQASFSSSELEDADAELKMLSHAEDIKSGLSHVSESLSGGDQPLVQQVKSLQHQLSALSRYHAAVEELSGRLHSAQIELQDIAGEVERLTDEVVHDPLRIERLNERTALGYRLLKKHGVQTTADLLALQKGFKEKLQAVTDVDGQILQKEREAAKWLVQLQETAAALSEKRKKEIRPFQDKVNRLLMQVGMPNARLKVSMENRVADIYGMDSVEFLFDANLPAGQTDEGSHFEPIRKVASGGELSRLMLSIKSLVAESMDLPTLIFDEIDTGISGEAAKQVGAIMSGLAQKRQVITITHQPQIAGKADVHLFVHKDIRNEMIRTNIRLLSREERITAIAKMLGGERPTAAALENAREMVMN